MWQFTCTRKVSELPCGLFGHTGGNSETRNRGRQPADDPGTSLGDGPALSSIQEGPAPVSPDALLWTLQASVTDDHCSAMHLWRTSGKID